VEKALKNALVLILLAAVADGSDGLVARNVECSPLGKYLDSLADMLSFGIAPAIIAYVLVKSYFGITATHLDVVLAFCGAYMISGMLRLARFDAKETQFSFSTGFLLEKEKVYFEGFPITGSAILLVSVMLLTLELPFPHYSSAYLLIGLMGILCFLMTSRIRYRNMKDRRIVIPLGIVFFTLCASYFSSLPFVYPTAIIVAVTAFYMCSPLARVFAPVLR